MKSFDILINHKDNQSLKKCCLLHTLLKIELLFCDKKTDLLFSNFLKPYQKNLQDFIHENTSFKNEHQNILFDNFVINDSTNQTYPGIEIKDLLKIVQLPNNKYFKFKNFLANFEILYKNMKINSMNFNYLLKKNKIISNISKAFNVKKEELVKLFLDYMKKNENISNII